MFTLFPTQGYHVVYMCPSIIFQILLLYSRPMMSYHVTCHVTVVSCASSSSKRKKKRKRKIVSVQAFHNSNKGSDNGNGMKKKSKKKAKLTKKYV